MVWDGGLLMSEIRDEGYYLNQDYEAMPEDKKRDLDQRMARLAFNSCLNDPAFSGMTEQELKSVFGIED